MNNIEVKILNPEEIINAEKMMICAARLTQRGHKINSMSEFMELYDKPYTASLVSSMAELPHPTIQKFGVINVAVVGASRRFLAQITRHQNEVKFMSASLQYSDYSTSNNFTVPYGVMENNTVGAYLDSCEDAMENYAAAIKGGLDNDSAGFMAPQGLRNVLIISATPYQWKHMISQRVCRRNTDETRIVMLKIWEQLIEFAPNLFSLKTTGPFCMKQSCVEGKMSCSRPIDPMMEPTDILKTDYPLLKE